MSLDRRRALMGALSAIPGVKYTQYTTTSGSVNVNINKAAISPIANDEILIWNIRGTRKQSAGSVGGKMGVAVLQNGIVIANSSGYKRMKSVEAPDDAVPASTWNGDDFIYIQDGKYYTGTGPTFNVGAGNTIDFIQIPYNIGWNVSGG